MIENQYGKQGIIQLPDELLPFCSKAVLDILRGLGITEKEEISRNQIDDSSEPPFS